MLGTGRRLGRRAIGAGLFVALALGACGRGATVGGPSAPPTAGAQDSPRPGDGVLSVGRCTVDVSRGLMAVYVGGGKSVGSARLVNLGLADTRTVLAHAGSPAEVVMPVDLDGLGVLTATLSFDGPWSFSREPRSIEVAGLGHVVGTVEGTGGGLDLRLTIVPGVDSVAPPLPDPSQYNLPYQLDLAGGFSRTERWEETSDGSIEAVADLPDGPARATLGAISITIPLDEVLRVDRDSCKEGSLNGFVPPPPPVRRVPVP